LSIPGQKTLLHVTYNVTHNVRAKPCQAIFGLCDSAAFIIMVQYQYTLISAHTEGGSEGSKCMGNWEDLVGNNTHAEKVFP